MTCRLQCHSQLPCTPVSIMMSITCPCRECVALINELEAPVEYIILPTYAYEHKVFVAPMSRKYPQAKVFTSPSCALS